MPIRSEATKAPASEPMPPTTTTTKITEPTVSGHWRSSVTKVVPPMTPASPCQRSAGAEDEHEDARHVVAEGLDHLRVRQRTLDHEADPGSRQQQPQRDQHRQRDQHHEAARCREGESRRRGRPRRSLAHIAARAPRRRRPAGRSPTKLMSVKAGPRRISPAAGSRPPGAAPDREHQLDDHERQAEGDQQLPARGRTCPDAAQAEPLRTRRRSRRRRRRPRSPAPGQKPVTLEDRVRDVAPITCRSWRGRNSAPPSC